MIASGTFLWGLSLAAGLPVIGARSPRIRQNGPGNAVFANGKK